MGTPTASVPDHNTVGFCFDNTYARLPDVLFVPARPAPVQAPRVSILNHRLAEETGPRPRHALAGSRRGPVRRPGPAGLAPSRSPRPTPGTSSAISRCSVTAGPSCLGEHRTPAGRLLDVQFKGSGRTPFSRGGDGRAALGPMLREYVISEAMAALGIPTTRSLAVVTTGELVYRVSALPGAILTRVAASHIRVGTFEYAGGPSGRADPAGAGRLRDRPSLPGAGR